MKIKVLTKAQIKKKNELAKKEKLKKKAQKKAQLQLISKVRKEAEKLDERDGYSPENMYDLGNDYDLPWHYCRGCETLTPALVTPTKGDNSYSECLVCGSESFDLDKLTTLYPRALLVLSEYVRSKKIKKDIAITLLHYMFEMDDYNTLPQEIESELQIIKKIRSKSKKSLTSYEKEIKYEWYEIFDRFHKDEDEDE